MFPDDNVISLQFAFDAKELEDRKNKTREFFLPRTGLKFQDDHFGPRPGCLHSLLGSTGRGKSTLVQSMILKWAKEAPTLFYLSEESTDRIELKLFEKDDQAQRLTDRLFCVHESESLRATRGPNTQSFLTLLFDKLKEINAKILVIDNLTTSQYYEKTPQESMALTGGLRRIAHALSIPVFVVCHTKKGVSETSRGLILPDDVRGSASLANTSDYFYTFYRVRQTTPMGTVRDSAFIYVNKARDHDNQDSIYRLNYDVNQKRYVSDTQIDFNKFKEVMRERDRV